MYPNVIALWKGSTSHRNCTWNTCGILWVWKLPRAKTSRILGTSRQQPARPQEVKHSRRHSCQWRIDSEWLSISVFVKLIKFEGFEWFTSLYQLTQTFVQVKKFKLHLDDVTRVSIEQKSFQEGPYSSSGHPGASWSYTTKAKLQS